MNDSGKIFAGFFLGMAAGVAAGLLLAPDSGENTRKKIANKAGTWADDASERLSSSIDRATQLANDLAKRSQETAKEYSEKVKAGLN